MILENYLKKIIGDIRELHIPEKVKIIEVVTRDGFQSVDKIIPTNKKIELIDIISETGVAGIEVTSFVRSDVIPQLADAKEVMKGIKRAEDIVYSVLVPNIKGAENAIECKADEWGLMISLSEEHSKRNVNSSKEEAIGRAKEIINIAKKNKVRINGGILTAFQGTTFSKKSIENIESIVNLYYDLGIKIINIADTEGHALPREVYEVMLYLRKKFEDIEFVGHFHNTYNRAIDNALAALAAGVYTFDCAIGGIGGCPALPFYGGNLETGKFISTLQSFKIDTGIDLAKIQKAKELLLTEIF